MRVRLFPEAAAAVAEAEGGVAIHDPGFDVEAAREEDRATALAEPREPLAEVRDLDADGVACRVFRPEGARAGVVVHLHGGGFVFNDLDVHDNVCRRLADRAGVAVLAVDYRRPPEHVFPAAVEDVDSVLAWLASHGAAQGLAGPAYVHGDSAGGNLALVAALRHPGVFAAVALTYPFLDPDQAGATYDLEGVGFDRADAAWYWDQYAPPPQDRTDPDLAPLRSERLGTLPPTLVTTAEGDPLRDEGELLAARLAELGVPVVATRYQGQVHGFWRHPDAFPAAEQLTRQVAAFLATHGPR